MRTVIVGAGPTGLLLAGDLAAAGVDVTVLERRTTESNLTRAFGVHARTLEHLDARGLADDLVATGQKVARLRLFDRIKVDLSGLPTRFPYLLITPQYNVERLLERRALQAGAKLLRGVTVTGLGPHAVHTDGDMFEADHIVGADGVHSKVRESLGMPFPGKAVLRSIMLADVRLTDAPSDVLAVNAVGDAFAFVAPFGDGWFRVFAWDRLTERPGGPDQSAPLTLDEVRDVTRRALGTDFGMHDARFLSRFHSDERQVPHYRQDDVFLAGDAAHVHSPAGGQGMNTGLQDAANLSWKLAAVAQGWAPGGLLDTYETERHPVGELVLRSSGGIIRLAMLRSGPARLGRDLLGSMLLRVPAVLRKAAGTVSGIGIDYPGAPRQGDLLTSSGQRLYELLRPGRPVLLGPDPLPEYEGRVTYAPHSEYALVRPDGHRVAFSSRSAVVAALPR